MNKYNKPFNVYLQYNEYMVTNLSACKNVKKFYVDSAGIYTIYPGLQYTVGIARTIL